jgi:peptidoglycan hydrolase-like protein with peptidoglycan-binding domain
MLFRWSALLASLLLVLAVPSVGAGATKKSSGKTASSTKKSAGKKQVTRKKGRGSKKSRQPARPKGQGAPEAARIQEIQQALSAKGYPVSASGQLDEATKAAIAKFQADNNLKNFSGKGKLDSLTLIALGLGPQREPPSADATRLQEGKTP